MKNHPMKQLWSMSELLHLSNDRLPSPGVGRSLTAASNDSESFIMHQLQCLPKVHFQTSVMLALTFATRRYACVLHNALRVPICQSVNRCSQLI